MDWQKLERDVDSIVGAAFGESVYLAFMAGGRLDPDRPSTTARAILHVGADETNPAGQGFATRISAGEAELILDRATYDGPVPKTDDKVRADDRTGQPWWRVASVSDRFSNLIIARLTQA